MEMETERLQELIGRVTKEVERNRNMTDEEMKAFIQRMVKNEVVPQQYLTINEQYDFINQIYKYINS